MSFIHLFHIYECQECVTTFGVEQALEDQSNITCPECNGEDLRDVGQGEMKIMQEKDPCSQHESGV